MKSILYVCTVELIQLKHLKFEIMRKYPSIRRSVEKKESVVSKFELVKPAGRRTMCMLGGVPHKLVGSEWVALKKVV